MYTWHSRGIESSQFRWNKKFSQYKAKINSKNRNHKNAPNSHCSRWLHMPSTSHLVNAAAPLERSVGYKRPKQPLYTRTLPSWVIFIFIFWSHASHVRSFGPQLNPDISNFPKWHVVDDRLWQRHILEGEPHSDLLATALLEWHELGGS